MNNAPCEFCGEIQGLKSTRFRHIYESVLSSRIVAKDLNFVALPTLGQIFKGSLLIIPKQHVETFAQLPIASRAAARKLTEDLQIRLKPYGEIFIYEHGAKFRGGGGCGVYHAHLHIVPLPKRIACKELINYKVSAASNLEEVWSLVEDCDEYLAIQDGFGSAYFSIVENSKGFGSQYCRRRIVEYFGIKRPWDWRKYDSVEKSLLSTVEMLGVA